MSYVNDSNNIFKNIFGIYAQLVMLTKMEILIQVGRFLFFYLYDPCFFNLKDEWLDVMNDIIGGLKEKNEFPEWYEGLHKALYRANEFMGNYKC